jgi:hypothetical protein
MLKSPKLLGLFYDLALDNMFSSYNNNIRKMMHRESVLYNIQSEEEMG